MGMLNRLGGEGFSLRRRPQLSAVRKYVPKVNLRNILIALVTLFILRNFLKKDYQKEEMKYLRDPISQAKELEMAIHGTEDDRFKFLDSRGRDVERLKKDIIYLLKEVKTLRSAARDPHSSISGRDSDLKDMDNLHLQKRKEREAQLLKDHPNFVPHRKVKGEGTATA
jgi:hypothetical protein